MARRVERRRGLLGLLATAAVAVAAGAGKPLEAGGSGRAGLAGRRGGAGGGDGQGSETPAGPATSTAQAFSMPRQVADQARAGEAWREFLRVPSLSMGVYSLKKGAEDGQTPHKQDEVYYVSAGRAVLEVDGTAFPVETGSVVFVAALARHRFRDISEDLTTLVFFAPAETE